MLVKSAIKTTSLNVIMDQVPIDRSALKLFLFAILCLSNQSDVIRSCKRSEVECWWSDRLELLRFHFKRCKATVVIDEDLFVSDRVSASQHHEMLIVLEEGGLPSSLLSEVAEVALLNCLNLGEVAEELHWSRLLEAVEEIVVVRQRLAVDSIDSRPRNSDNHHKRHKDPRLVGWRNIEPIVPHSRSGNLQCQMLGLQVSPSMENCSWRRLNSCLRGCDLVRSHRHSDDDWHQRHIHQCTIPFAGGVDSL